MFIVLSMITYINPVNGLCTERAEGGFTVLNLHWNKGEISFNGLKKVSIPFEGRRKPLREQFFFLKVISKNGENIFSDYFNIPTNLKYDFFEEDTGILKGGAFERDEVDFVVKLPQCGEASEIRFYQRNPEEQVDKRRYKEGEDMRYLCSIFLQPF